MTKNDYLVYERVKGLDLYSYFEEVKQFQAFPESEVRDIATQLVSALLHSHKSGIAHLDIKLDNIMINPKNQQVTVIDFGLCDFITEKNGGNFTRRVGSEQYCAPELLDANTTSFSGVKLDVWCLGVVLYCLLAAKFPFAANSRRTQLLHGGRHPTPSFNFPISENVKDLLRSMLQTDPVDRISMQQVASHPWLQQSL